MLHVQCRGCGTSAYVECTCPPGHNAAMLGHLPAVTVGGTTVPACAMGNLDAQVVCPPGSGCCQEDHDHGAAANTCTGEHEGEHGKDNPDCAVCRPLVIAAPPGSAEVKMTVQLGAGS